MSRPRKLRKQENQKGYSIYSLSVPAEIGDKFDVDNDKFYCSLTREGHILFSQDEVHRYESPSREETQEVQEQPQEAEEEPVDDTWDFAQEETPESVFEQKDDKPSNSMFEGW